MTAKSASASSKVVTAYGILITYIEYTTGIVVDHSGWHALFLKAPNPHRHGSVDWEMYRHEPVYELPSVQVTGNQIKAAELQIALKDCLGMEVAPDEVDFEYFPYPMREGENVNYVYQIIKIATHQLPNANREYLWCKSSDIPLTRFTSMTSQFAGIIQTELIGLRF